MRSRRFCPPASSSSALRRIIPRPPAIAPRAIAWRTCRLRLAARAPDLWDAELPPGVVERNVSMQALQDAITVRELLFRALPGLQSAEIKVYRETAGDEPRLIIAGIVTREERPPKAVRSLAMILCPAYHSPRSEKRGAALGILSHTCHGKKSTSMSQAMHVGAAASFHIGKSCLSVKIENSFSSTVPQFNDGFQRFRTFRRVTRSSSGIAKERNEISGNTFFSFEHRACARSALIRRPLWLR
jgi:hypothetical protein